MSYIQYGEIHGNGPNDSEANLKARGFEHVAALAELTRIELQALRNLTCRGVETGLVAALRRDQAESKKGALNHLRGNHIIRE